MSPPLGRPIQQPSSLSQSLALPAGLLSPGLTEHVLTLHVVCVLFASGCLSPLLSSLGTKFSYFVCQNTPTQALQRFINVVD